MNWVAKLKLEDKQLQKGKLLYDDDGNITAGRVDIEGDPIGQPRPKVNFRLKRFYYTEVETDYRNKIKTAFLDLFNLDEDYEPVVDKKIPVELYIRGQFNMPKTRWRKKYDAENSFKHLQKPDWDNIAKMVGDSLNGLLYPDDKQIWKGITEKREVSPEYPSFLRIAFQLGG